MLDMRFKMFLCESERNEKALNEHTLKIQIGGGGGGG